MMSIVDWNANSGPPGDLAIIFLRRVKERRRTKLWVHTLDTTSAGSVPIFWASVSPLMGQVQRKGTSRNCPPPKKKTYYTETGENVKRLSGNLIQRGFGAKLAQNLFVK